MVLIGQHVGCSRAADRSHVWMIFYSTDITQEIAIYSQAWDYPKVVPRSPKEIAESAGASRGLSVLSSFLPALSPSASPLLPLPLSPMGMDRGVVDEVSEEILVEALEATTTYDEEDSVEPPPTLVDSSTTATSESTGDDGDSSMDAESLCCRREVR